MNITTNGIVFVHLKFDDDAEYSDEIMLFRCMTQLHKI